MKAPRTWARGLGAAAILTFSCPSGVRAAEPIKLGTKPEGFTLPASTGAQVSLFPAQGSKPGATVLMFLAVNCEISQHYNHRIALLARAYQAKGVRFLGINSDRTEHSPSIAKDAVKQGFSFPVLKDAGAKIANAFGANVTPEIFVLDQEGALAYHGRFDDSENPNKVKAHYLKDALDALLDGKAPERPETRAFGCSILR